MSKFYYMRGTDGGNKGRIYQTLSAEVWNGCEVLTQVEGAKAHKAQTVADLKKILKPGKKIWANVDHVSASGMSHVISLYIVHNGEIVNISHRAAIITGWRESKNGGLIVSGCGMDMGFHTVYTLARCMFPNGSRVGRGGKPDKDGGYSLDYQRL